MTDEQGVPRRLRRLCGRWLIVRCLRLGLTLDDLAAQTGVDAETLSMLTLGLDDTSQPDDDRWSVVAERLADPDTDADFVRAVLRLAGGDMTVPMTVLTRVREDVCDDCVE